MLLKSLFLLVLGNKPHSGLITVTSFLPRFLSASHSRWKKNIHIRAFLQPIALPSNPHSPQLRRCGLQPWTWHFLPLSFNYVWAPEGHKEDRVQLADTGGGQEMPHTQMYSENRPAHTYIYMPGSIDLWTKQTILKRLEGGLCPVWPQSGQILPTQTKHSIMP